MRNKLTTIFVAIFLSAMINVVNTTTSNSKPDNQFNKYVFNNEKLSDSIIKYYNRTHNLDSIINNCRIGFEYPLDGPEGERIIEIDIEFNDSASIVITRSASQIIGGNRSKVKLTKQTANYFKSLLFGIYSEQRSVIKDSILSGDILLISHSTIWSITLDLPNQKIAEYLQTSSISFNSETAFHPQFKKIQQLVRAIKRKMEKDIYKIKNIDYKPEPWIEEMFHGEYYEPYNDINFNKYQ
ncbi:MAG: hypothetical protein IKL83_06240 [Muribaculaceae bacterium]|nr:hypothetical protein [Muribaculaceae bacterium]